MSNLSMAQLGPVSPLIDHARARFAVGMIADELFPPMMVDAESGQVLVWDDSFFEVPNDTQRAIGAPSSAGADPKPSYMNYACTHHARHLPLTPRELAKVNAQGMGGERLRFAKARKLADQLKLVREVNLATKLTTDANYETGYNTDLTTTWAETGGDPIGDIQTGISKIEGGSVFPNVIAFDIAVWRVLERNSQLLDLMKVHNGKLTTDGFFSIFGLRAIIAKAKKNTAGTFSAVWGDSSIIAYVEGDGGMDINDAESDMTLGRTLMDQPLSLIETDAPELDHKPGAVKIEAEISFAHQFIGVDNATDGDTVAAYHIDNCI